jgi:hypothetical protein
MITHVSGRMILGRKRLHMFQEEGYWEGNVYTCLRKKDIEKETSTRFRKNIFFPTSFFLKHVQTFPSQYPSS